MTQNANITGKLDSEPSLEEEVVDDIERALHYLRADTYESTFGDDEAGDLVIKLENGDEQQTITLEAHAWPEDIFDRILAELKI
jgi:hypothetical protein